MQPSFIQRFGTYLTLFFVAICAVATGLYFFDHTFRGLSPQALDCAQLARNIFRGAGFSSNILPADALANATKTRVFNPELGQGPLFPVLLGAIFAFAGERDAVVAGLSLGLFFGTTLVLYCLAGRLTRSTPLAAATAIAFVFSRAVLGLGVSGQPQALSSFFLLLTLLVLTPKAEIAAPLSADDTEELTPDADFFEDEIPQQNFAVSPAETRASIAVKTPVGATESVRLHPERADENGAEHELAGHKLSANESEEAALESEDFGAETQDSQESSEAAPRRAPGYLLAGAFAALCYLSDPLALVPLVPLMLGWGRGLEGWKRPAVLAFALGCLVFALPWWVRNARLTGDPFFSTQWLAPDAATGLLGLGYNAVTNGRSLLFGMANVPHFLLAPFLAVSPWMRPLSRSLARLRNATLWSLLLTIAVLGALGHGDVSMLLPFAPLLTLLGIVTFRQVVGDAFVRRVQRGAASSEVSAAPNLGVGTRIWLLLLTLCGLRQAKTEFLARRAYQTQVEAETGEAALDGGRISRERASLASSLALLLLFLALPLLALPDLPPRSDARAALEPLGKVVPQNGAILTDAPQGIAWYGDRNVVPLSPDVKAWFDTPKNKVEAIYLLAQNGGLSTAFPLQWREVAARGLDLPGYRKVTQSGASNLVYLRQTTPEEARLLVKAKPKSGAAYVAFGNALLQKRNFAAALPVFQNAARLLPQSGDGFYGAGVCYLGLRNLPAARAQFERAQRIAPRSIETLLQLAGIEQSQSDKRRAIALYERVLADVPGSAIALNNLANLYADGDGNLFRALEMARRAATQNPQNGSIIDTLGWVCFRLGYRQEALAYLKRAAQLEPQNSNIISHLQQAQAASANAPIPSR